MTRARCRQQALVKIRSKIVGIGGEGETKMEWIGEEENDETKQSGDEDKEERNISTKKGIVTDEHIDEVEEGREEESEKQKLGKL